MDHLLKTIKLMIKTLRYAFVAALMMVAGAVNAQTTFNFKNLMDGFVPAAKDVLFLYKLIMACLLLTMLQ